MHKKEPTNDTLFMSILKTKIMQKTLLILSIFCLLSCEKQSTIMPQPEACTLPNVTKKLDYMIIERSYLSPLTWSISDTISFFYDAQGRLDSIHNWYQNQFKFYYDADQRPEKYIVSQSGHAPKTSYFEYTGQQVSINDGRVYTYDTQGHLIGSSFLNFNDYDTYATDNCGQIVKHRSIYHTDNKEHYLWEAEYSDTYNPLFLIGLHRFFIGPQINMHLPAWSEIVHWDCADYASGKAIPTIVSDVESLPIKTTVLHEGEITTRYFYK
jgi:hypothetical protein